MAEAENGGLSFAVDINTTEAIRKVDEFNGKIQGIGTVAKDSSQVMDDAMHTTAASVQSTAKQVGDNLRYVKSSIDKAFERGFNIPTNSIEEIKAIIRTQKEYIQSLETEYNKAAKAVNKMAPGNAQDKARAILSSKKQEIEEEKAALDGMKAKYDDLKIAKEQQRQQDKLNAQEQTTSTITIRGHITQIVNQLAQMRLNGQQNTDEYKKLEQELGNVATKYREVKQAQMMDSTGATQIRGIMQGLQGLMGAYTAASGVMGMFVKDQEQLMKVQAKMQSMMAILMGMQQVANALHSTSTFRLRTVAKAQELWTLAINKTKVALTTGTVAARAFKIALAATGVGLLVIALGALVSAISKMKAQAKEASAELNKLKNNLDVKFAGIAEITKAKSEIEVYKIALQDLTMTEAQNKKLVDELNSKYGSMLGQYSSKAEWLKVLKEKTEEYTEALRLQAETEARLKQMNEAAEKKIDAEKAVAEAQTELVDSTQLMISDSLLGIVWTAWKRRNLRKAKEELTSAEKEFDGTSKQYTQSFLKSQDATNKLSNTSGSSEMEAIRKQGEDIKNARADLLKDITANEIALMQEGKNKKLAEIEAERVAQLAAIDKEQKDLAAKLKEAGKGGLSKDDKQNFATKEKQVNDIAKTKTANVEKENAEQIAKLYKQVGDVFITEEQRKLNAIKERYAEMRKQLKEQKEGGNITETQYVELSTNVDKGEARETANYWLEAYGNYDQKRKALDEQWKQNLANIPPEYMDAAVKQMQKALSELDLAKFKESMDWEGVFGNIAQQSSQAIQYNLAQVVAYFEANKDKMGVDEIKDMQKAIADLNSELSGRNPFYGLLNSIDELKRAKADVVAAMQEIATAEAELEAAQGEQYSADNDVLELEMIIANGEAELDTNDKLEAAKQRLAKATENVGKKQEKLNAANKKGIAEQSKMASSYRKFTSDLSRIGGVMSGLGQQVKALAGKFDDDLADGIGKAFDLFDALLDSTTTIINAISDTSKKTTEAITSTVSGASAAMTATSAAASTSIKTVESASVILTIISAALSAAMAIANLFDGGNKQREEEIEALQTRIDQLQWELNNADTMRLTLGGGGDMVVQEIEKIYAANSEKLQKVLGEAWKTAVDITPFFSSTKKFESNLQKAFDAGMIKEFGKELNKSFSQVDYTADKALGPERWKQASQNATNLSEQLVAMQLKLEKEESVKESKRDNEKIQEIKNEMAETYKAIQDEYNNAVEDIIGGSAEDIANQLGDAIWEAFRNGEDAAKAWGDTVDDIVADVMKRMLIQQFLTARIGAIFDEYKEKWMKPDGSFDFDLMMGSMGEFSDKLKQAGEEGVALLNAIPEDLKETLKGSADRQAAEKGIASISQESADEMNGRMTAIQSHTYSINENTKILVQNSAAILESVIDIKENTEAMKKTMNEMRDDIAKTSREVTAIKQDGVKMKS